jgi:hypothetical protein
MKTICSAVILLTVIVLCTPTETLAGPPELREESVISFLKSYRSTTPYPFVSFIGMNKPVDTRCYAYFIMNYLNSDMVFSASIFYLEGRGWYINEIRRESLVEKDIWKKVQ